MENCITYREYSDRSLPFGGCHLTSFGYSIFRCDPGGRRGCWRCLREMEGRCRHRGASFRGCHSLDCFIDFLHCSAKARSNYWDAGPYLVHRCLGSADSNVFGHLMRWRLLGWPGAACWQARWTVSCLDCGPPSGLLQATCHALPYRGHFDLNCCCFGGAPGLIAQDCLELMNCYGRPSCSGQPLDDFLRSLCPCDLLREARLLPWNELVFIGLCVVWIFNYGLAQ